MRVFGSSKSFSANTLSSLAQGILAGALVLLLACPAADARGQQVTTLDQGGAVPEPSARYPIGTSVQVHLRNKETITGQVEKYAGDGFWIRAEGHGARKDQRLFYFDIQSIKRARAANRRADQPRFGIDFSVAGAEGSFKVYRPKSEGSDESY